MEEFSLLLVEAQLTPSPQDFSSLPRVSEVFTPIAQTKSHEARNKETKRKSMTTFTHNIQTQEMLTCTFTTHVYFHNMKIFQEKYYQEGKKNSMDHEPTFLLAMAM